MQHQTGDSYIFLRAMTTKRAILFCVVSIQCTDSKYSRRSWVGHAWNIKIRLFIFRRYIFFQTSTLIQCYSTMLKGTFLYKFFFLHFSFGVTITCDVDKLSVSQLQAAPLPSLHIGLATLSMPTFVTENNDHEPLCIWKREYDILNTGNHYICFIFWV